MKEKKYVKNKDLAKILYDLYENYFNRYDVLRITTDVTKEQYKKYSCCHISEEEIWAYDNNIFFMGSAHISILDKSREWYVGKHSFISNLFLPVYRIENNIFKKETIYNEELHSFIIDKNLGKGVFVNIKELKKWKGTDSERINEKDAYKLLENLKHFFN